MDKRDADVRDKRMWRVKRERGSADVRGERRRRVKRERGRWRVDRLESACRQCNATPRRDDGPSLGPVHNNTYM